MKDELNALKTTRFAKKGVGKGEGCISPTAHIYTLIWLVRVCSPYFNSVGILTACCCNMLYLSFHLYLYSAANGCTKNHQRIGVTVHSHYFESLEDLLQQWRRGRGCSELWKNAIFPEHPVGKRYAFEIFFESQNSEPLSTEITPCVKFRFLYLFVRSSPDLT